MNPGRIAGVAGDGVSIGVLIGTLADWLPPAAALFTIFYTIIQISETKRFEQLLRWVARLVRGGRGDGER